MGRLVGFCGKTWRKRGESDDQESFSPYHFSADNPIRFSDPDGRTPIIPLLIAAYEIGSSIYDAYQAYKTVNDPNASKAEKATTVAATRVVGDIKRIENFLEVVGHWRQQKVGSLNKRFENFRKRSIDALSKTTGVALDGRPAPPGPASAAV